MLLLGNMAMWASLLVWAAVVIGAGLTIRGVWGDRARGRRRCPGCWYDLRDVGTPREGAEVVCSVCGKRVKSERELRRTRRSWRWVVAGLVVMVGPAASVWGPGVYRHGPLVLVPTNLLPALLWMDPEDSGRSMGPVGTELRLRLGVERSLNRLVRPISEEERLSLMRRLLKGYPWARPASDAWMDTCGRVIDIVWDRDHNKYLPITQSSASSEELEAQRKEIMAIWKELPHQWQARTRPAWPAGSDVRIEVVLNYSRPDRIRLPTWQVWQRKPNGEREVVVTQQGCSGTLQQILWAISPDTRARNSFTVRLPKETRGPVMLELEADRLARPEGTMGGSMSVQFEMVDEGTKVLRPVHSQWLDWMIEQRTSVCIAQREDVFKATGVETSIRVDVDEVQAGVPNAFDDVIWSSELQLQRDGITVATTQLMIGDVSLHQPDWYPGRVDDPLGLISLREIVLQPERWRARFVGRESPLTSSIDAKYYWGGQIDLPVFVHPFDELVVPTSIPSLPLNQPELDVPKELREPRQWNE